MENKKADNNGLLILVAFLLGLVIGMFVSPMNGISIGNNNKITGGDTNGCGDDDDEEYPDDDEYSY